MKQNNLALNYTTHFSKDGSVKILSHKENNLQDARRIRTFIKLAKTRNSIYQLESEFVGCNFPTFDADLHQFATSPQLERLATKLENNECSKAPLCKLLQNEFQLFIKQND